MPVISVIPRAVEMFAAKLRFPQLFLFVASLFVLDLLIPDLIPFADEILLGLLAVLLGSMRQTVATEPQREVKDVTPRAPESTGGR